LCAQDPKRLRRIGEWGHGLEGEYGRKDHGKSPVPVESQRFMGGEPGALHQLHPIGIGRAARRDLCPEETGIIPILFLNGGHPVADVGQLLGG